MASTFKRGSDKNRAGSSWMVNYFDAQMGKRRTVRGYTDRAASLALGERLERDSARRAEGLVCDLDDQERRPIAEQVGEYVTTLRASGRNPRYVFQVERRLALLISRTGARRAVELDPTRILCALAEHRCLTSKRPVKLLSVAGKNEYISTVKSFARWCVENRRAQYDPLASLKKLRGTSAPRAHPRRALTPDGMVRLLDAAERRPLIELLTVRTGKRRGTASANVRPRIRDRAIAVGRERRLAYMVALWTGLRRSELASLRWGDIELETLTPCIKLRAEATKAKRADTIAVHPQLAGELRAARPEDAKAEHVVLKSVPSMRVLRADLKLAGIDAGDAFMGFVDLHALRMSFSTMMAARGMSQRSRQAQMRHSDPRLTEVTYMDDRLLPIAAEFRMLPKIGA